MQVHPLDPYTLINTEASDPRVVQPKAERIPSPLTRRYSSRIGKRPAFTAEETRHHFAIEALDKAGPFRPQPYLYTCVRCRWIFRVNDSRGSVIALDGLGRRLPEPENAKRAVTFHRGPCPAFPVRFASSTAILRHSRGDLSASAEKMDSAILATTGSEVAVTDADRGVRDRQPPYHRRAGRFLLRRLAPVDATDNVPLARFRKRSVSDVPCLIYAQFVPAE